MAWNARMDPDQVSIYRARSGLSACCSDCMESGSISSRPVRRSPQISHCLHLHNISDCRNNFIIVPDMRLWHKQILSSFSCLERNTLCHGNITYESFMEFKRRISVTFMIHLSLAVITWKIEKHDTCVIRAQSCQRTCVMFWLMSTHCCALWRGVVLWLITVHHTVIFFTFYFLFFYFALLKFYKMTFHSWRCDAL